MLRIGLLNVKLHSNVEKLHVGPLLKLKGVAYDAKHINANIMSGSYYDAVTCVHLIIDSLRPFSLPSETTFVTWMDFCHGSQFGIKILHFTFKFWRSQIFTLLTVTFYARPRFITLYLKIMASWQ